MKHKGFTLIELLVVIAIIGILSSVGLSTFTTAQIKGRDAKRKTHLSQLA
ncbi:prepilin-type N-terminal cleavage/methylation domain-containing protein, partial [Microgenomates group bacterium]|nr:prepilin-type N-terminal cleavage/methylation domain-containing protein [Microgenomates group bacterium]